MLEEIPNNWNESPSNRSPCMGVNNDHISPCRERGKGGGITAFFSLFIINLRHVWVLMCLSILMSVADWLKTSCNFHESQILNCK